MWPRLGDHHDVCVEISYCSVVVLIAGGSSRATFNVPSSDSHAGMLRTQIDIASVE